MKKRIVMCCANMNLNLIGESIIIDGHAWNIHRCSSCHHMYVRGIGLDPLRKRQVLVRVILNKDLSRYQLVERLTKGNIYADN